MISVLLYRDGQAIWHQGRDSAGDIDVATIEIDPAALPEAVALKAFTPEHLQDRLQEVKVGTPLLMVGFPLGFHDTLHHLPVVRQAFIASSFGLRFQGQGFFLTDARTHHGHSGAPLGLHRAGVPVAVRSELLSTPSACGPSRRRVERCLGIDSTQCSRCRAGYKPFDDC